MAFLLQQSAPSRLHMMMMMPFICSYRNNKIAYQLLSYTHLGTPWNDCVCMCAHVYVYTLNTHTLTHTGTNIYPRRRVKALSLRG